MNELYLDLQFIFNKVLNDADSLISWELYTKRFSLNKYRLLLSDKGLELVLNKQHLTLRFKVIDLTNSMAGKMLESRFNAHHRMIRPRDSKIIGYDKGFRNLKLRGADILALFITYLNKQNTKHVPSKESSILLSKGIHLL